MPLCPDCTALSPYTLLARPVFKPGDDGIDPHFYILKPDFPSLEKSAKNCSLCNLILRELELNYDLNQLRAWAEDGIPTPVQVSANSSTFSVEDHESASDLAMLSTLWVLCGAHEQNREGDRGGDEAVHSVLISAQEGDLARRSGDVAGRILELDTGSEATLNTARNWMEICLQSRPNCPAPAEQGHSLTSLPTRVLDVGPADGLQDLKVSVTRGQQGRYATLSHCWGKSQLIITTIATLATRMQQIPFHDLSKTFQDAVVVTRRLGLQYLWIDSLCIIQDSEDDWRREAARMASVYNNAVFTIAATAAKESSQGLFMPHPKVSGERAEVPYNCKERRGKGKDLGAAKMILCHRLTAYDDPDKYIERSPLNQRGWVLQERLLSKRTLHFAENQIFWECNSLFASEDGTIRDEHPELRLKQEFQTKKIRPWSSAVEEGDRSSEIKLWCRIVEEYTQRSLTVDSDRLPALAGITMAMLEKLGFEPSNDDVVRENFAAGLWKSALHVGILWQACDGQLRRPSEYRAPSWSWAALEGPVRYDTWLWSSDPPSDSDSSMFAEVQVEGEYLTGRIKKAYLDLNCMIKHATYDPAEKCLVGISVDEANMPSRALFCPETQRRLGWCVLDEGTGVEKRTVCCALISRSKPSEYVRRYRNLNGTENILVLDRKGSSSVNEFVRIGIGQIDVDIDWYDLDTPVETNCDLIQEPEQRQKWKNWWTHVIVF